MDDHNQYPGMPIKATPYQHQRAAFEFACRMFGLTDSDRSDNRPENLAVLPRAEHHRLHMYLACGRMESQQEGGDVKCQKKPPFPEA